MDMPPCKQLLTALGFFPKSKEQNNAVAVGRAPRASSCEEGSAAWTLPWPGDLFEQSKHKETALCEQWCLEHGQHQASGTLLWDPALGPQRDSSIESFKIEMQFVFITRVL